MAIRMSVRLSLPKKQFKDIHVKDAIYNTQQAKTGPEVKKMFEGTTEGWKTHVDFKTNQIVSGSRIGIQIFPNNSDVYNMVSLGTPRHPIPKKPGFVRYQAGYISATLPGSLRSIGAQRFGSFRTAKQVNHPGFQGRDFDFLIGEKYKSTFYKDMQDAINEAVSSWEGS